MARKASMTDFSRTHAPREEWLARAKVEEPLEAQLPIVDAHAHLWHHPSGFRYLVADLAQDIADCGHNVIATVFVECRTMYRANGPEHLRPVGEVEFAAGQGAMADSGVYTSSRIAAGIVGYADLTIGDKLPELLDAQLAAASGRLTGIRMGAKWDPDPLVAGMIGAAAPGLYLEPEFQRGLREVVRRGLVFEASIYHPQIADVTALARSVPEAQIVLVHTGSPVAHSSYRGREDEVRRNFVRDMTELARCPNVSVKLGGLLMTLGTFDFGQAERPATSEELAVLWRPYIEPCLTLFGPERCMVSSNFPRDKAGLTYSAVWNMFKRLTAGSSTDEKIEIFGGTAKRLYIATLPGGLSMEV
jgi:L-fuconolactonase